VLKSMWSQIEFWINL